MRKVELRDYRNTVPRPILDAIGASSVGLLLVLPFLSAPRLQSVTAYVLLFGIVTFCLAEGACRWLVSRPIEALGRVSYSGYLWHFALLSLLSAAYRRNPLQALDLAGGWPSFLAFFAGLVIATFGLSAFTHRYVERPGIEFGRYFARAWRRARAIA